jgi:cytochrome P450
LEHNNILNSKQGHDTTTLGITFALMLLANHQEVQVHITTQEILLNYLQNYYTAIQDRIMTELNDIFGEDDRLPTMEDLNNMNYLEMCLKEALRLYPSVPFISRGLKEDLKLSMY